MQRKKVNNQSNTTVDEIVDLACKWLDGSGPEADIIISSRVRLARNVQGICYPNIAKAEELQEVREKVAQAVAHTGMLEDGLRVDMAEISQWDKRFLVERRLISPQFAEQDNAGGIYFDRDQNNSVMVNEEDHLRLQAVQSGLQIEKAWQEVSVLDEELSNGISYDFSDQFGYLTACPTNTGTGMRVSIFVHLPALAILEKMDTIIKELSPSEITVRGFHGEGSGVQGNIFQISNQLTLGRTDENIVKRLQNVAERFVALEREGREELLAKSPRRVKDIVFRAEAILRSALLLNAFEFIHLLSAIRLGSELEIIAPFETKKLNELLVIMQPAHLRKRLELQYGMNEDELGDEQRDAYRAQQVREYLKL